MLLVKNWRKGLNLKEPISCLIQDIIDKSPLAIEGRKLQRRVDFMTSILDLIYQYQDVITVNEQMLFNAYKKELRYIATELKNKQKI